MTSYSDLPEENQHVFITIACQCGVVGEESNCCQMDRAHIDLTELYDSNGYPENMSLQFLEYLYDVCSTTRAVIGTNVLKPSGEGSMNDVGVVGNGGGEGGTEGSEGTDGSGVEEEDVGPLGITFYRPKPIPPMTADEVDEAAEGSDAVDASEGSSDRDDSDNTNEDENTADAVTEGDVEPREASTTEKLSTGGIIGIAVAGGVVLLAILAFLVMRNKKKNNSSVVDDDANIKLSRTSPPPPNMNDVNGMMMTNPQQAPDDITNVTTDDYSTATENHGSTPVTTTGSFANASSPSGNLNKLDSLNDPNDTTMLSNNTKGRGPSELWPGQV